MYNTEDENCNLRRVINLTNRKRFLGRVLLAVALVLVLASVGGIYWHANSIISSMANVRVHTDEALLQVYADQLEQIEVASADGLRISAWHFPQENPKGVALVLHGMHGMDASSMLDVAKFFHTQGYAALSVDMRAHGRSEGERIGFGYSEVNDVAAVLDWVKQSAPATYSDVPVVLYGHSMGASTAIRTAAMRDDVAKVISVAAFESMERQIVDYMRNANLPEFLVKAYQPFFNLVLSTKYGVKPAKASPLHDIASIAPRPVLLIHGDQDEQTDVGHSERLQAKAGQATLTWVVEGGNHFVFNGSVLDDDNEWFRDKLTEFINR